MKDKVTRLLVIGTILVGVIVEAIFLTPPFELSIERGLEIMNEDEYLEITPKSVRLRKQFLTEKEKNKQNE